MIEPYNAVGLVPTVWGISKRADIMRNIEHHRHMVKAACWLASLDLPVRLVALPEGALQGFNDEVLDLDHATFAETCAIDVPGPETDALGEICREYGVYLMAPGQGSPPRVARPLLQHRLHPRRPRRADPDPLQDVAVVPGRALGLPARRVRLVDRALRTHAGRVLAGGRHAARPARHHDGQRGLLPGERPGLGDERRRGGLPGLDPAPGGVERLLRDPEPGSRPGQQPLHPRPQHGHLLPDEGLRGADRHVRRRLDDRRLPGPDRRRAALRRRVDVGLRARSTSRRSATIAPPARGRTG